MTPARDRFESQVAPSGDHAIWMGTLSANGYGRFFLGGRFIAAHRAALMFRGREVPTELTVDHLCRVRRCVNPDHLELVSIKENVLRGTGPSAVNAAKTHCPQGHDYTPENTYFNESRGYRRCRVCMNAYRRRRYHATKGG